MRLPRHDTPLSLPAETPREAIEADEALLDQVVSGASPVQRWWVAASRAIVVGIGLWRRRGALIDLERCQADGVDVLERRAGGGAVLLEPDGVLCGAVAVPMLALPEDVTESYLWLGDRLAATLRALGVAARRVDVSEARADVAALRSNAEAVSHLLLSACYGALSPHEIVVGDQYPPAKLVGLAQIRRRHAALFQFGILLRDQSRLADYLLVADPAQRERLRAELKSRTVGMVALTSQSASAVAAAIVDAMPSAL